MKLLGGKTISASVNFVEYTSAEEGLGGGANGRMPGARCRFQRIETDMIMSHKIYYVKFWTLIHYISLFGRCICIYYFFLRHSAEGRMDSVIQVYKSFLAFLLAY